MKRLTSKNGLTLVELLIAVVAGFFVFAGIATVFRSSTRDFARAENFVQLRTKLNSTVDHLSELLMQAGADLPDTLASVVPANARDITIIVNPTGAMHLFGSPVPLTTAPHTVSVDAAKPFLGVAAVIKRLGVTLTYSRLPIATTDNTSPFIAGVDTINNRIRFANAVSFAIGDAIFACDTLRYYHNTTNRTLQLVRGGSDQVYADNIDDLSVTFFDVTGTPVTDWNDMNTCSLFVRIKASRPEKGVAGDGYRRVESSRVFYFRNRRFN